MSFNIKGIVHGVEKNADKLATLFGYYSAVKKAQPSWGLGDMIVQPIQKVVFEGKIPDLDKIIWRLTKTDYCAPIFKNGLMLLIGGELAKGIVPSKWTSLAQKAGQGLATGAVIAAVGLGMSPAGEPHTGGSHSGYSSGNSPSWGYRA